MPRVDQTQMTSASGVETTGCVQRMHVRKALAANDNHRTHAPWRRFVAASMAALFAASAVLVGLICLAQAAQSAEITGKSMTLSATERQVKVAYFRAPGEAKRPTALLLHGGGGFDRRIAEYNHYASELANAGIDAYLVYYYSAEDERGMSSGDVDTFTGRYPAWAKLVNDLAAGVLAEPQSNGKVGLVGFSNGGILATGASTLNPKINAAVIYYGTEPWPLRQKATRFPPLLVLHGDADQVIPVLAGHQLAALAESVGSKVDLVIYPGEGHGFAPAMSNKNGVDALKRTITFLKRELSN
jgi:carboxymethylenebutenolidase